MWIFSGAKVGRTTCCKRTPEQKRRDEWLVLGSSLFVVFLTLLTILLSGCKASDKKPVARAIEPTLTPEQVTKNVESFDIVWTTIKDKHYDVNLNGADWQGARDELRPKVEAATTMSQARLAMEQLIAKLKQTHFGIIAQEAYAEMDEAAKGASAESDSNPASSPAATTPGTLGLTVRALDGKVVVIHVDENSPAYAAGITPGYVIEKVGKADLSKRLEIVAGSMAGKKLQQATLTMTAMQSISVDTGDKIRIVVQPPQGKKHEVVLTAVPDTSPRATFGNLPPMTLVTESKTLASGIGYAHLSIWLDPPRVNKWFTEFMKTHATAPGIIIDLRGNMGGLGAMAMGMGGFFDVPKNSELGTMIQRDSKIRFVLNPRARAYKGKLAILVDELSLSTSEIFAGGMKDIGRAKVFGTPTPGAALPSTVERLPNGDGFQYAYANYISFGGTQLEGNGVAPHLLTPLTIPDLAAGKDPALEAAIAWINSDEPTPPPASPATTAPTVSPSVSQVAE